MDRRNFLGVGVAGAIGLGVNGSISQAATVSENYEKAGALNLKITDLVRLTMLLEFTLRGVLNSSLCHSVRALSGRLLPAGGHWAWSRMTCREKYLTNTTKSLQHTIGIGGSPDKATILRLLG